MHLRFRNPLINDACRGNLNRFGLFRTTLPARIIISTDGMAGMDEGVRGEGEKWDGAYSLSAQLRDLSWPLYIVRTTSVRSGRDPCSSGGRGGRGGVSREGPMPSTRGRSSSGWTEAKRASREVSHLPCAASTRAGGAGPCSRPGSRPGCSADPTAARDELRLGRRGGSSYDSSSMGPGEASRPVRTGVRRVGGEGEAASGLAYDRTTIRRHRNDQANSCHPWVLSSTRSVIVLFLIYQPPAYQRPSTHAHHDHLTKSSCGASPQAHARNLERSCWPTHADPMRKLLAVFERVDGS